MSAQQAPCPHKCLLNRLMHWTALLGQASICVIQLIKWDPQLFFKTHLNNMLYDDKVTVIWNIHLASTKWLLPLDFNNVLWDDHLTAAFSKRWSKIKRRAWRNGHKLATTLIKTVLEQLLPALGWGRLPAGRQRGGLLLPFCGPLMELAEI